MNKIKTIIVILLLIVALGTVQINTYALHEQNQTAQSQFQSATPLVLPLAGSGGPNQNETTTTAGIWKTCEDPILQISIECLTNWNMEINEDGFDFEPDTDTYMIGIPRVSVEIEPVFPMDTPDKFMRRVVNEERGPNTQIIGLNETTINDRPAYRAHYNNERDTTLQIILVDTSDYT
jgi:hypothetical protein